MARKPDAPDTDYEAVYRDEAVIPWEIGEPQPALAALVEAGWCEGAVLDIGCGTGELGLALAARGHPVTGIDVAASAIEAATRKAAERGLTATFRTGDATALDEADGAFDTVLDSGLLHCLRPDAQVRYLGELRRVVRGGGRVAVLCFADRQGASGPAGKDITEGWLRELFASGWVVDELDPVDIHAVVPGLPADDRGWSTLDAWLLRARRVDP